MVGCDVNDKQAAELFQLFYSGYGEWLHNQKATKQIAPWEALEVLPSLFDAYVRMDEALITDEIKALSDEICAAKPGTVIQKPESQLVYDAIRYHHEYIGLSKPILLVKNGTAYITKRKASDGFIFSLGVLLGDDRGLDKPNKAKFDALFGCDVCVGNFYSYWGGDKALDIKFNKQNLIEIMAALKSKHDGCKAYFYYKLQDILGKDFVTEKYHTLRNLPWISPMQWQELLLDKGMKLWRLYHYTPGVTGWTTLKGERQGKQNIYPVMGIDHSGDVEAVKMVFYKQAIRCYNIIMSSQTIKALDGSHLKYNKSDSVTFNLKDQKTLPALFKYIVVNVWDKVKSEFSITTNDEDLQDIIIYKGTGASITMPIDNFLSNFAEVCKAYELNINLANIKDIEDTLNAPSLFN